MADRTRNAMLRKLYPKKLVEFPWVLDNSAAQTVYRGCPMMIDPTTDTLYAVVYKDSVTKATGDVFLGIADAPITIATTETEGDVEVDLIVSGLVGFLNDFSFTNADSGKPVYFSDSQVLTTTAGSNLLVGKILYVENGYVFVNINEDGCTKVQL